MTRIYQDLLTHAYAGFNQRDINAVLAIMHPEVEWANGMEGDMSTGVKQDGSSSRARFGKNYTG